MLNNVKRVWTELLVFMPFKCPLSPGFVQQIDWILVSAEWFYWKCGKKIQGQRDCCPLNRGYELDMGSSWYQFHWVLNLTGIYLKGAHRSRIYYATAACFTLRLDLWKLLGLLLRNFLRTFHRWIGSLAKVLEMCSILEILLPQYQASPSLLRCRYNAQPESIKTLTGCRTGKSWKKVAGPGKFWKSIKLNETLETSAFKSLKWPIHINPVDKTKFSCKKY